MSKLNLNRKLKGQDLISDIIGKPDLNKNDKDIKQVKTYLLIPFKNHPFKLYEGNKLNDMIESIKEYGILSPVIAREIENREELELLSGHNRVNAAKIIGLETVPTIIKNVDDDTAQIIVAEANFMQRQDFLPSERAKAYKMQLDALNRQGKKRNTDICSNGTYVNTSREEVAKNNDTSASQIRRYIRLNYLTDELLDRVDKNILGFRPAVEISYLSSESQKIIESLVKNQNIKISLKQAETLKIKEGEIGQLSLDVILEVLSDKNKNDKNKKIAIPLTKIKKYFDEDICEDEIVEKIIELLEISQV
ncbi:ParB family chromosome partitioning protein [Sedimentibacter acidaminivorans]|uniref:ParB family chromosome partitioning protein n=1 Tax=Sedimentibacter acidaminivorans TaxID=913099 RepID=A0ABS4GGD9_9FIRM|nr:ParB/RepB/Spo0J family partition protein [Sedimentibacter acidaminivorans]MBP1926749.1 ParB family chromosome partitioning protein [Sedimentibacter acidaminivorans]